MSPLHLQILGVIVTLAVQILKYLFDEQPVKAVVGLTQTAVPKSIRTCSLMPLRRGLRGVIRIKHVSLGQGAELATRGH